MESDSRYYARRAAMEFTAAAKALTPAARERRRALAESFATKASALRAAEAAGLQASISY